MKILLTGASGQLGREILNTKPKGIEIINKNRFELDLFSEDSCINILKEYKPQWVINCAAYTNVDKAEDQKDIAYSINALAPKYFSKAIKDHGGDLLHISTDYVFDGNKGSPYHTTDRKSPLSIYGYTKAKGEDFIIDHLADLNKGNIIRTSWLMSKYGNNFAKKILNKFNDNLLLSVIADQIGCPTTASTLAEACWKTIELKSKGIKMPNIMHYCNAGVASWYDIAIALEEIGRELNLINHSVKVLPISSKSYPSKAKRPPYSVLDTFETLDKLSLHPINWRKAIYFLLETIKK